MGTKNEKTQLAIAKRHLIFEHYYLLYNPFHRYTSIAALGGESYSLKYSPHIIHSQQWEQKHKIIWRY